MSYLIHLIRKVLHDTRRITPARIIGFSFLSIVTHVFALSTPFIYQKLVTVIETQWSMESFRFRAGITLLRSFLFVLIDRGRWLTADYLRAKIYREKINAIYTRFISMHIQNVLSEGTGKLLTRLNRWVLAQADIFLSLLKILYNTLLRLTILSILFIIWEPLLAILLAWSVILSGLVQIYFTKKMKPLTQQETELYEE